MTIFLIVYALGIMAALCTFFCSLSGEEITLYELFLLIVCSLLSWVACIVLIAVVYGNKVVVKVK